MASFHVLEVVFKAVGHAPESQVLPWNFFRFDQDNFEALLAGGMFDGGQAAAIEKVDLVDMGDADHGKWGVDNDICPSFLKGFPNGGFAGRFAVLHEPGGQCPVAEAWLDRSPAKKNTVFPGSDATHHQSGIFIVNVAASLADMPRKGISQRYLEGHVVAATGAELDHRMKTIVVTR